MDLDHYEKLHDAIAALLSARPLPSDAEIQLDALIQQLPKEERATASAQFSEALFVAQHAADVPVGGETSDLPSE